MRLAKRVLKIAGLGGLVVALLLIAFIGWGMVAYSPEYVLRVLLWRESSVETYREKFPARRVETSGEPFEFVDATQEKGQVETLLNSAFNVDDMDAFLGANDTEAFLVMQDDRILFEGYYNGADRDTLMTSYSVAKSFTSALIGAAIEDGAIKSVNDPITDYLPELAERDERFNQITIRHLLLMASGLEYQEMRPGLFNSDDILSTYYPDQRKAALEFTSIVDGPEEYFSYNKYHPQLLGLILERSTGVPVAHYLQEKIWKPLSMAYDGSWSLDSEESDFEKMETGVNAAAIDFVRFGRLFLHGGLWNGVQVLPADWVAESTQVDPAHQFAAYYPDEFGQQIYQELNGYYKYMWYGFFRGEDGYDFQAEGDRGQFIYVSPQKQLVMVRFGRDWGISSAEWVKAFYRFASDL